MNRSDQKPEGGAVTLRVSYVLRDEAYRAALVDLLGQLRERAVHILSLLGVEHHAYALLEDRPRSGWFTEVLRFSSVQQYEKFDERSGADRMTVTLQALLEETLDLARCDYVLIRGNGAPRAISAEPTR